MITIKLDCLARDGRVGFALLMVLLPLDLVPAHHSGTAKYIDNKRYMLCCIAALRTGYRGEVILVVLYMYVVTRTCVA